MNSNQWYYSTDGSNRNGPVRLETLRHLLQDHVLKHDSLVWNPAMPGWIPVHDVPELVDDVHLTPPPLPAKSPEPPAGAVLVQPETAVPAQVARPETVAAAQRPPKVSGVGGTASSLPYPDAPAGIAGWLILPAIGLVLGPIKILLGIGVSLFAVSAFWENITPGLATLAVVDILVSAGLLAFAVVLGTFFFRKKRQTVRLVIILMVLQFAINLILALAWELVTPGKNADAWAAAAARLGVAVIWIAYFLKSKRVANTFVK